MTLTKAELADFCSRKVGPNKREAKDMVEAFFEEIRNAAGGGRRREAFRLRQFPVARQAPASGPQPQDRGRKSPSRPGAS